MTKTTDWRDYTLRMLDIAAARTANREEGTEGWPNLDGNATAGSTLGLDGGRRSLAPAAWSCEAHRSVAVAAPIEAIVDPPLDHLNVAVAPGKRVAGEEWGASRNNKCPILQP
jgi:hypothetical protein